MRDQVELHSTRRWYAVATHPHREAVAREDLAERDLEVFLPLLADRFKHPRKRERIVRTRPLCPGYVFVHVDLAVMPAWGEINRARGVVGILCSGERPIPARRGQVERLLELAVQGDGLLYWDAVRQELKAGKPPRRTSPFRKGDRVRLRDGHILAGSEGQYVGGDGEEFQLELDILGRTVLTTAPAALVLPA